MKSCVCGAGIAVAQVAFAVPTNVVLLNGQNGFHLVGATNDGVYASAGGDLDGDGFDDLVVGIPKAVSPYGYFDSDRVGGCYVVFGASTGAVSGSFTNAGIQIRGLTNLGLGSPAIGDWDGDGIDDLLLQSRSVLLNVGRSAVIYGRGDRNLQLGQGFIVGAPEPEEVLSGPSSADVDGDGYCDFLSGTRAGGKWVGAVLKGRSRAEAPGTWVSLAPRLVPESVLRLESSGADIDGDGRDEVCLASIGVDYNGGRLVTVLSEDSTLKIAGVVGPSAPMSISTSVGDINGDGWSDVMVGQSLQFGTNAFVSVIFGRGSNLPTTVSLDGPVAGDVALRVSTNQWGFWEMTTGAGDIDGDGLDDLVLTEPHLNQVQVVWGRTNLVGSIDIETLSPLQRTVIGGFSGAAVRNPTVCDFNGDGVGDLVLGDPQASSNYGGAVYVLFGDSTRQFGPVQLHPKSGSVLPAGHVKVRMRFNRFVRLAGWTNVIELRRRGDGSIAASAAMVRPQVRVRGEWLIWDVGPVGPGAYYVRVPAASVRAGAVGSSWNGFSNPTDWAFDVGGTGGSVSGGSSGASSGGSTAGTSAGVSSGTGTTSGSSSGAGTTSGSFGGTSSSGTGSSLLLLQDWKIQIKSPKAGRALRWSGSGLAVKGKISVQPTIKGVLVEASVRFGSSNRWSAGKVGRQKKSGVAPFRVAGVGKALQLRAGDAAEVWVRASSNFGVASSPTNVQSFQVREVK